MDLLAWIFIGVLVGWAALAGNRYGPLMDMVMGIGGAVAGGLRMRAAGFRGFGGTVITSMVAVIGLRDPANDFVWRVSSSPNGAAPLQPRV